MGGQSSGGIDPTLIFYISLTSRAQRFYVFSHWFILPKNLRIPKTWILLGKKLKPGLSESGETNSGEKRWANFLDTFKMKKIFSSARIGHFRLHTSKLTWQHTIDTSIGPAKPLLTKQNLNYDPGTWIAHTPHGAAVIYPSLFHSSIISHGC